YLPHEAVMKSIELLGTHVIPELKKRGAAKMAQGLQNTIKQTEKHVAKSTVEERDDRQNLWGGSTVDQYNAAVSPAE
ncbi:MAG TPA: hypothetical protein VJM34_05855, partial [Novosphingobium sp.]|nr:hypothetical protein [Novosphingobium sp.]